MKTYVICMYTSSNSISVVGPFKTKSAASKYGNQWQKEHADNPCWQVLSGRNDLCILVSAG